MSSESDVPGGRADALPDGKRDGLRYCSECDGRKHTDFGRDECLQCIRAAREEDDE